MLALAFSDILFMLKDPIAFALPFFCLKCKTNVVSRLRYIWAKIAIEESPRMCEQTLSGKVDIKKVGNFSNLGMKTVLFEAFSK